MYRIPALALVVLAAASLFAQPQPQLESQKLHELINEDWEWRLRDDPETATSLGDQRFDALLADRSPAAFARRREHDRQILKRIEAVDRAKLGAEDKLNYDLFLLQARMQVEGSAFPQELAPVNQMGGVYSLVSELAQQISRDTVKDHE